MIVTFRSKAHADIMMFGDVAVRLLKLMGHSGTVPGRALGRRGPHGTGSLKKGRRGHKAAVAEVSDPVQDDDSSERPVNLPHRALPLIHPITHKSIKSNKIKHSCDCKLC